MLGKRLRDCATTALLVVLLPGCTAVPGPTSSASPAPSPSPSLSASASPTAVPTTLPASPTPPAPRRRLACRQALSTTASPTGPYRRAIPWSLGRASASSHQLCWSRSTSASTPKESRRTFASPSDSVRPCLPADSSTSRSSAARTTRSPAVRGDGRLSAVFFTAQGPASGAAPVTGDGSPVLQGLVKVDEFEGYLNYGLGLQLAPQSDQVRLVRCGHLQYVDNRSAPYVVFVDVQG